MPKQVCELISKFGPKIGRFTLGSEILDRLISLTDEAIEKDEQRHNDRLAGQINKEITLTPSLLNIDNVFEDIMKEYVRSSVREIFDKQDINVNAFMTEAWVNSQFENEYNPVHYHPGCTLSATAYLKMPKPRPREIHKNSNKENVDGAICFINKTIEHSDLETATMPIIPREGDLYIWPSKLLHCVYPFKGSGERRSIAFNAWHSIGEN